MSNIWLGLKKKVGLSVYNKVPLPPMWVNLPVLCRLGRFVKVKMEENITFYNIFQIKCQVCIWFPHAGIGRCIAKALSAQGAHTIALSRTQADLDSLRQEVTGYMLYIYR